MRQRWPFGSKRGAIPQSVEYIMPTKWVGALCGYSAVTVFFKPRTIRSRGTHFEIFIICNLLF
nr:MAG TPA: hypothetical protein [Caudoviricetes sp.]